MMLDSIVFAVRGKTGLVIGDALFKFVPIRPTVFYSIVFQNIKTVQVFMIGFFCEAVES